MSPVAISLLMLAAFAGFGSLAARKLAIVAALAPEDRFDHPGARLRAVLTNGFLQQRMIRRDWKPGIMHAVIFLGFMALLVRKLQLIVIGYDEPFVYPGLAGGAFAAAKDVVELAVLVALAYAFWRRYVTKPARLEPNREALLILSLITAIMVTRPRVRRLPLRAVRRQRSRHRARARTTPSPARVVAGAVAALSPAALAAGYHASYWTQIVVVFAFLVILPPGEHFHIVTALPALYFRRGRPANAVPSVDLEKIMGEGSDADDDAGRRAHRDGPHVEGRPRRLHLHRVRPLQGRLPDVPHRQAAVAEVGERQPQAPPARAARRRSSAKAADRTRCRRSSAT